MKTRIFLSVGLLLFIFSAEAQKTGATNEMPFRTIPVNMDAFSHIRTPQILTIFDQGIFYDGDSAAIFPVKYTKQGDEGLVKMDRDAKVVWELSVSGAIIGVSRQAGNILVFYIGNRASDETNPLMAVLVDPATGKKLKEKAVYQNASGFSLDIKIQNNQDRSFNNLLVRMTPYKGKHSFQWNKAQILYQTTEKLNIIYLNENLGVSKNIEKPDLLKDIYFLGCLVNEKHEIFLLGHNEKTLIAQKLSPGGEVLDRLETPLKTDSRYPLKVVLTTDQKNPQGFLVSLNMHQHGDRVQHTFLFDFAKKNILQTEPLTADKSYRKSLNLISNNHIRTSSGTIEDLGPEMILQTNDKLIVFKDVMGFSAAPNSSIVKRTCELLLVSFYDRNLHLLKETGIDKYFDFFFQTGCSSGYHIKDNILYMLTAANTGNQSYVNLSANINLQTMTISPLQELPQQDGSRRRFIEAGATLWFSDGYILSNIIPLGISGIEANTVFEKRSYN